MIGLHGLSGCVHHPSLSDIREPVSLVAKQNKVKRFNLIQSDKLDTEESIVTSRDEDRPSRILVGSQRPRSRSRSRSRSFERVVRGVKCDTKPTSYVPNLRGVTPRGPRVRGRRSPDVKSPRTERPLWCRFSSYPDGEHLWGFEDPLSIGRDS